MERKKAIALGLKTYNTGKPCKSHPDKADGCERYTGNSSCVEYKKEHDQTPKRKESEKKRRQTPERKEYQKEYQKTPKRKESEKKRRQTPERKEYQKEYQKNRHKNNIQVRLAANLRTRLCKAIKNGQKAGSAVRDLGCSIDYLKSQFESQFEPGMSWDNWSNKEGCWSIDHIKPLSRFNLKDRQQCLEACHYTNLRPMWHIENIKKGNK